MSLINCFDTCAVCEHCLFEEQLGMLEISMNYAYIAVSADDNPHILSGNIAHGDVALLWKRMIDDFFTPLQKLSLIASSESVSTSITVILYLL